LSAANAGDGVVRLRAEVVNTGGGDGTDQAVHAGMMCAHLVAWVGGGSFVSPGHPPDRLAEAAAACSSEGLWPVLAGAPGTRDTVLAAPVVLYDWPQGGPARPGGPLGRTRAARLAVL